MYGGQSLTEWLFENTAHFLPGFLQLRRIYFPSNCSYGTVNLMSKLENKISMWIFYLLHKDHWYADILTSNLICRVAFLMLICLNGKGQQHLNIPMKIFRDPLKFSLASSRRLDRMTSRASFQPKLFYDNYELCSLSEDLKEL